MISFLNDYNTIAASEVLSYINKYSTGKYCGYGQDELTNYAKELIRKEIKHDAEIFFISGGTMTNLMVIQSMLKSYEACISVLEGHINTLETGAIENTGRKILTVPSVNGKITVEAISEVLKNNHGFHMVIPKMVYISNATEAGTVYTKEELQELYRYCQEKGLYLFIDGARLGTALVASGATLEDIYLNSDVFYIGGTKNGAMFGEAVCFKNSSLCEGFLHSMKQHGALMAKGFNLGIQFIALFETDLFYQLAKKANDIASYLASELKKIKIDIKNDPAANQVFISITTNLRKVLEKNFLFTLMDEKDGLETIRLVTTYNSQFAEVDAFISAIKAFQQDIKKY